MPYRESHVAGFEGQQWLLKRNCALSPAQLGCWFGTLAALSLLLAGVFAAQGAWMVVPFAAIELAALAVAFVVYGRHAGDYERILVTSDRILVERSRGGRLATEEVGAGWARVEYRGGRSIRLVSGRTEVAVGSFLPEESRERLARELRASLAARRA